MGVGCSKRFDPDELASTGHADSEFMISRPERILILGDSRIKTATALYLKACDGIDANGVEIIVGTSDLSAPKNAKLIKAEVKLLVCDLKDKNGIVEVVKSASADVVFLVTPANKDRTSQSLAVLTACRRGGCGHLVILSTTLLDRPKGGCIFADQCRPIETYLKV